MENGRSNIPLGRIMDLVRAYEMPADFGLAIMATYYPDMIAIIQEFMESKEIKNILKKSEKKIENDLSQIVEREAESVGLSF
jgi:uncharacterized protein YktB (UPF0637 family)